MIRKNLKHNSVFQYKQTHKIKTQQQHEDIFFAMLSKNAYISDLQIIGNACHKIIRKFIAALCEYCKNKGVLK